MTELLSQTFTLADALPVALMLALLAFAVWSFTRATGGAGKRAHDIRTPLLAKFGLTDLPQPWANLGVLLWVGLLIALGIGAVATIFTVPGAFIQTAGSETDDATLRWTLLTLTALTGALGAVIALPFTLIRIRQTQRQNDLQDDSLFNDKINAAAQDLAARRQVTKAIAPGGSYEKHQDFWEDDLVTRAAAIDRLEGLALEAMERGDYPPAQRIARMLSIYLQELSRAYPPKEPPNDAEPKALRDWARALTPIRPDMQRAAQSLGSINPEGDTESEEFDPANIDLRRCNLQGLDLSHLNLQWANFWEAELQGADLGRAQLQGSNFFGAELQGSDLKDAKMKGADLREAQLQGADLLWAQLQGADLTGAQLQGASLREAQLQGADLREAKLQGAYLGGAKLQGADLGGAQLQGASLGEAQMQGADLFVAQLQGASLREAQLQGSNFFGAELQGANLGGAKLQGAYLGGAQLDEDTNLSDANLQGAALRYVDATTLAQFMPHAEEMILFAETRPEGWPGHFVETDDTFDYDDFLAQWRAFAASLDPPVTIAPDYRR